MPYVGSYIWKLRQGVGDMRLLTATVDVVCVNEKGELCMVYNRDFDSWAFPGGHVEAGLSWGQSAAQEALEEAKVAILPEDLVPFASISGNGYIFQYKDGSTQVFSLIYTAQQFVPGDAPLDTDEILETRWVSLAEAESLSLSPSATHILPAYKAYIATGAFQQVIIG